MPKKRKVVVVSLIATMEETDDEEFAVDLFLEKLGLDESEIDWQRFAIVAMGQDAH